MTVKVQVLAYVGLKLRKNIWVGERLLEIITASHKRGHAIDSPGGAGKGKGVQQREGWSENDTEEAKEREVCTWKS